MTLKCFISIIRDLFCELPHKLLKELKLRTLGKYKIKIKSQNRVERQASAQPLLQKLIFVNSGQNLHKSRYQSFLVLPKFTWFSYFALLGFLTIFKALFSWEQEHISKFSNLHSCTFEEKARSILTVDNSIIWVITKICGFAHT